MKFEAKVFECLCSTDKFVINGKDADSDDFVHQENVGDTLECGYGCTDMKAVPIMPTQKVMDKYNITLDEYTVIANDLETKLSLGECGWCV